VITPPPIDRRLLTGTTIMIQCDGSQFDITSGNRLASQRP
jgi:hypothetical protein